MSPLARRWWLLATAVLALASAAALALLGSGTIMLSVVRNPLLEFVQPGVIVWWLVLGGPFRSGPSSPSGIAFAAVANTTAWLLVLWLLAAIANVGRVVWSRR